MVNKVPRQLVAFGQVFSQSADAKGFELGPKRRWRHSESYLRSAAAAAGLDVAGLLECVPRTEAGKPVEGYAVALICT